MNKTNPRDQGSHSIKIEKKTKLFNIISSDKMFVNSAHHQAVEKVGKNVVVNAIADDGVIEGIEHLKLNFPSHRCQIFDIELCLIIQFFCI